MASRPNQTTQDPTGSTATNLFISGLRRDFSESDLERLFARFGSLVGVKLMLNVRTGTSRGFGFAMFQNEADAAAAMAALDNTQLPGGETIHVAYSVHDGSALLEESARILIRNVPANVNRDESVAFFAQFGTVIHCEWRKDMSTKRFMVMLEYKSSDEAAVAVKGIDGQRPFSATDPPLLAKLHKPGTPIPTSPKQHSNCATPNLAPRMSSRPSHERRINAPTPISQPDEVKCDAPQSNQGFGTKPGAKQAIVDVMSAGDTHHFAHIPAPSYLAQRHDGPSPVGTPTSLRASQTSFEPYSAQILAYPHGDPAIASISTDDPSQLHVVRRLSKRPAVCRPL